MALGSIQQLPQHQPHHKTLSTAGHSRLLQQLRPIAPAPAPVSTSTRPGPSMSPSRRSYMPYSKSPYSTNSNSGPSAALDSNHPSVVRRNARERNRVKQVNNGFLNLRQHIPQAIVADLSNGRRGGSGPGANKKLSKVNTLRMALEYIRLLQCVIDEVDQSDASSVSSCSSRRTSTSMVSLSASPSPPRHSSNTAATSEPAPDNVYLLQRQQAPLPLQQRSTYCQYNFADGVNKQQLLQQQLISPAASTNSSVCSEASASSDSSWSALFSNNNDHVQANQPHLYSPPSVPFKFEPKAYEDYHATTATEDEELLDYISLWQDDI